MNAALPVAAAAAAALFLFAGKSKAAPAAAPKPAAASSGKTVAQRMAEVIATGEPATIRAEATRLRAAGKTTEAAELERVAGLIAGELAKGNPAPTVKQTVPTTPMPTPVPNPPVVPTGPNAPWLAGVPAELQGVILKRTNPVAYDKRVETLQARLQQLKYGVSVDGKFGPGTESAVIDFQRRNNVTPTDGIVGPITLIKLADPNAKGNAGTAGSVPLSMQNPASAKPPAPKPAPAPAPKPAPAPAPKPAPAPAPKPVAAAPAPPKPAPAPAPKPAPAPAGKAPAITAALRSSGLLRNGKATGYKAPASSGQAVKDWQQVLFDLGFIKTKPDGKFGDVTEAGTRAFQTAANSAAAKSGKAKISVDGIVGPATIARAAEARIVPSGGAAFTGDYFGDDSTPLNVPGEPIADTPLPGLMPPMAPKAPDPMRALAARLYNMLELAPRGGEDRTLVALYQSSQGLKPTGYYGPATALSLARAFGIVPPKPLYWTDSRTRQSKTNYRDAMRAFGERDPQRVEEWRRAGDV